MSAPGATVEGPSQPRRRPRRPRLGLSSQVIIGLVLGILAGLFFGEPVAVVQPLGAIFIGLLQMTVIPYIVVSLIAAIGRRRQGQRHLQCRHRRQTLRGLPGFGDANL